MTTDCPSSETVSMVKLILNVSSSSFSIVKVGFWGVELPNVQTSYFIEDPYPLVTHDFDLLVDTSLNINLPTYTSTPTGCFDPLWTINRKSDDTDMEFLYPSVFGFSDTELEVTHTISDFVERKNLFGLDDYYVFASNFLGGSTATS